MLDPAVIDELAQQAAQNAVKSVKFLRVMSTPTVGLSGEDVLRMTVVFDAGPNLDFSGGDVLDVMREISHALLDRGDDRFPIIRFMTEADLATDNVPES